MYSIKGVFTHDIYQLQPSNVFLGRNVIIYSLQIHEHIRNIRTYLITGHCGQPSCLWPIFLRLDYSLHPDDYRQRHWQRSGHHCGPQITQHEKGVVSALITIIMLTYLYCYYSRSTIFWSSTWPLAISCCVPSLALWRWSRSCTSVGSVPRPNGYVICPPWGPSVLPSYPLLPLRESLLTGDLFTSSIFRSVSVIYRIFQVQRNCVFGE